MHDLQNLSKYIWQFDKTSNSHESVISTFLSDHNFYICVEININFIFGNHRQLNRLTY